MTDITEGDATAELAVPRAEEGAYGLVYINPQLRRATKVFLRSKPRDLAEKVFRSEADAYVAAMASKELKPNVPAYLGERTLSKVVVGNSDRSSDLYLDLAYEMELLDGPFIKINAAMAENRDHVERLCWAVGIKYTIDASVMLSGRNIIKLIDFATTDPERWVSPE